MDEYNTAVELYEKLCEERPYDENWSDNIIEGSVGIKSPIAWQNFHSYLSNTSHSFVNRMLPSLGDAIDNGEVSSEIVYNKDPYEYDYKTVDNGPVRIIRMTPKSKEEEKLQCL